MGKRTEPDRPDSSHETELEPNCLLLRCQWCPLLLSQRHRQRVSLDVTDDGMKLAALGVKQRHRITGFKPQHVGQIMGQVFGQVEVLT